MNLDSSPTNRLLYSTCLIRTISADGAEGSGTGFFFCFPIDDKKQLPLIVTNKHVVRGAKQGYFRIHLAKKENGEFIPSDESENFIFEEFEEQWFPHPSEHIDLCAMPLGPVDAVAKENGKRLYVQMFEPKMIPSQEQLNALSAVEDILMVGYPSGLWDSTHNYPLIRRGITASHPSINFNGEPRGVVDIACFPGSSGSPVLVLNLGSYASSDARLFWPSETHYLLGVLAAGPVIKVDGTIVVEEIPTTNVARVEMLAMMHLGYYVKSAEILALGKAMLDFHEKNGE